MSIFCHACAILHLQTFPMREQSTGQIYIILVAIWILWVPHSPAQAQKTSQSVPQKPAFEKSQTPPKEKSEAPQENRVSIELPPPLPREKPIFGVWSEKEIRAAQTLCSQVLESWKIIAKPLPAIADYDKCGDPAPLLVSEIYTSWQGKQVPVKISPPATLNCKMAGKTARWLNASVQKAADEFFSQPITTIFNVASYHCRKRYNALIGKMSEHAFANALDISTFQLQDGSKISLIKDWVKEQPQNVKEEKAAKAVEPVQAGATPPSPNPVAAPAQIKEPANSIFLKTIHKGACVDFSTVLGPKANAAHADHFHLDLGRNGRYQICE